MGSKARQHQPSGDTPHTLGQTTRSIVSLLIVIHLFCALVGLAGMVPSSPLVRRLLVVLSPYIRTLNFDLDYTPYYLTHNDPVDVDHRIEILPRGKSPGDAANWEVLPESGFRGGERYKRYQRLARVMALYAEDPRVPAQIAKNVAVNYLREHGEPPAKVRCRRHLPLDRIWLSDGSPAERDPHDPMHFSVLYGVNVTYSGDELDVARDPDAGEAAAPGRQ